MRTIIYSCVFASISVALMNPGSAPFGRGIGEPLERDAMAAAIGGDADWNGKMMSCNILSNIHPNGIPGDNCTTCQVESIEVLVQAPDGDSLNMEENTDPDATPNSCGVAVRGRIKRVGDALTCEKFDPIQYSDRSCVNKPPLRFQYSADPPGGID